MVSRMLTIKIAMVSRGFMLFSLLLIQLSSFEGRVHPFHPKTSGKNGDRRTFGRTLGGIGRRNFGSSNGGDEQRTFGINQRTFGINQRTFGINQRTFGRPLGGIDRTTFERTLEITNTRNADPVSNNTDPENTGSAMDLENPASTCSCNGAIDEIHHGKCSKETVWCYVDPLAPCEDYKVWYGGFGHGWYGGHGWYEGFGHGWYGGFGHGWSYSHEACEASLAEVHKDQCQVLSENQDALNTTESEDNECSCNGELDSLDMGECGTPWIGRFWCYVDSVGSGCEDAQVWYGEFGFCKTISFLACDSYDNGDDYKEGYDNADGLLKEDCAAQIHLSAYTLLAKSTLI